MGGGVAVQCSVCFGSGISEWEVMSDVLSSVLWCTADMSAVSAAAPAGLGWCSGHEQLRVPAAVAAP